MSTNPAHPSLEAGGHTFTGLFIGTPCGSGRVRNEHAISMLKTVLVLEAQGMHVELKIEPHNPIVMWARNKLASAFMDSGCSHMLCVDDDLRWYPQDVLRMIEIGEHHAWVCGAAHANSDDEEYAVILPSGELLICPGCGCVELEYGNVSFALLHRSVFERMFAAHPELKLKGNLYGLFDTLIERGKLWGDDYGFCRRWKAIGGQVWLDPNIVLTHYGVKGWTGDVAGWLRRRG